jgi:hypothetical protein
MAERHRRQIDLMIDEMVAAGKSGQDILTAIVALSRFSLHECKVCLRGYDSGRALMLCLQSSLPAAPMRMSRRSQSPFAREVSCPPRSGRRVAGSNPAAPTSSLEGYRKPLRYQEVSTLFRRRKPVFFAES